MMTVDGNRSWTNTPPSYSTDGRHDWTKEQKLFDKAWNKLNRMKALACQEPTRLTIGMVLAACQITKDEWKSVKKYVKAKSPTAWATFEKAIKR